MWAGVTSFVIYCSNMLKENHFSVFIMQGKLGREFHTSFENLISDTVSPKII